MLEQCSSLRTRLGHDKPNMTGQLNSLHPSSVGRCSHRRETAPANPASSTQIWGLIDTGWFSINDLNLVCPSTLPPTRAKAMISNVSDHL